MCDFKKANEEMCQRAAVSGTGTIESNDTLKVAYLCHQHKAMYANAMLDMVRVRWTAKVIMVDHVSKGIKCGKGHVHKDVAEVKACYNVGRRPSTPTNAIVKADGINCGHCRTLGVVVPTHKSVEEVKACYAKK